MFVLDLKTYSGICKPSRRLSQGRSAHVFRPSCFYPSHGLYAVENLLALRGVDYPDKLRRVRYYDAETDKNLVFLTNNFLLPAITIAQLYKQQWQVELFFKWIKQNLRIKSFYVTSENAVKTQIWIAISVCLIVAIIKKRLNIQENLYTILQVLSVSLFERTSMFQLFTFYDYTNDTDSNLNQFNLFTDYSGH
jgi:hypothetical protein